MYDTWKDYILLLTEYPPHYMPQKWYFPKRNRIISGLVKVLLVVEAKKEVDHLLLQTMRLEQDREVFAVPGPIL